MKKILYMLLGATLFLGSASAALADNPQPGFWCDPYASTFIADQAYIPTDNSTCTITTSLDPGAAVKELDVYKGTIGHAYFVDSQIAISDISNTFSFSQPLSVNSFSPQPGDPFFTAAYTDSDGSNILAYQNYLETGAGTPPADIEVLNWNWGAPATITANSQSINVGDAIPTLTATITGFVGGDTLATSGIAGLADCTTSVLDSSTAGDYPINCTQGTLSSAKYSFTPPTATYIPGTLHIVDSNTPIQSPSVTTVNCPASVIYSGLAQTPCTATVTGAGGLNQSVPVTYTDNTNAGTAHASASFAGDTNHMGSADTKNFTITKADQTITPTALSDSTVTLGDTTVLNASASSGLPVTYTVSGQCGLSDTTLSFTGAGICTVVTHQAGNTNFNAAPDVSQSINVDYRFDGFLQPINDTAHNIGENVSIFKGGSTVPVKFQLKKADGTVVQAGTLPVWFTPVRLGLMSSSVDELNYTDPATSGSSFKWDGSQYQYNWSTKGLVAGYWYLVYVSTDGGFFSVVIGLK